VNYILLSVAVMKNTLSRALILITLLSGLLACSSADTKPSTPIETFKTYTKAVKNKDVATMKVLLSDATMKMNELEAQARGVSVDDVVQNETLFAEHQKTVRLRNEKVEGDIATLEVENAFGRWEMVPFVKEGGQWKLDKKGFAQRMMDESDKSVKELDRIFDQPATPEPFPTPLP
jgi:hypothetical protein